MSNPLKTLTDTYLRARATYEDLSSTTREAKAAMDDAEQAMVSYMLDIGLDSIKTEDGVGFSVTRRSSYCCPADNRPELLNRLEREGYRELFTVSAQTLSALMKEKAAASEDGELPAEYSDLIAVHEETKLSVRGRKKY